MSKSRPTFKAYCKMLRGFMQYKKLPVLEFKEKARIAYDKKYGRKG